MRHLGRALQYGALFYWGLAILVVREKRLVGEIEERDGEIWIEDLGLLHKQDSERLTDQLREFIGKGAVEITIRRVSKIGNIEG